MFSSLKKIRHHQHTKNQAIFLLMLLTPWSFRSISNLNALPKNQFIPNLSRKESSKSIERATSHMDLATCETASSGPTRYSEITLEPGTARPVFSHVQHIIADA